MRGVSRVAVRAWSSRHAALSSQRTGASFFGALEAHKRAYSAAYAHRYDVASPAAIQSEEQSMAQRRNRSDRPGQALHYPRHNSQDISTDRDRQKDDEQAKRPPDDEVKAEQDGDEFFLEFLSVHNKAHRQAQSSRTTGQASAWQHYIPPQHVSVQIPSVMQLPATSLMPLYISIAHGRSEDAWSEFAVHLQDLHEKTQTVCADERLFDALFWLVASQDLAELTLDRKEELFNRFYVMAEYATTFKLEMTVMQRRRLFYAWSMMLEERTDKAMKADLRPVMKDFVAELDGRLVGSLVTELAKSGDLIEAYELVQTWQRSCSTPSPIQKRQEVWLSDDASAYNEEHNGILSSQSDAISTEAWSALLRCCSYLRKSHAREARDIGWFVLQQGRAEEMVDDVVRYLRHFVQASKYLGLLPEAVRRQRGKVAPAVLPDGGDDDGSSSAPFAKPDHRMQVSLLIPVATVLADRRDMRVAEWLLQKIEQNKFPTQIRNASYQWSTLFLKAASEALDESFTADEANRSSERYSGISLSLRYLNHCEWSWSDRCLSHFIRLLDKVLKASQDRKRTRMDITSTQWRDLARKMTLVLVKQDPTLERFNVESNVQVLSRLLALHISLNDYSFALRLFKIFDANYKDYTVSPLGKRHFLWMFQASLHGEQASLRDSWQLFVHWMSTDLSSERLKVLPLSLLRKFLQTNRNKTSMIDPLIVKNMTTRLNTLTKHGVAHMSQARRFLRVFEHERFHPIVLPILRAILRVVRADRSIVRQWQNQGKERWTSTNIDEVKDVLQIHVIALRYLSSNLEESSPIQTSECLRLFEAMRLYANRAVRPLKEKRLQAVRDELIDAYGIAVRVLRFLLVNEQQVRTVGEASAEGNALESQANEDQAVSNASSDHAVRIHELLREMEERWLIRPFELDRSTPDLPNLSAQILSYVSQGDWQEANRLYTTSLNGFVQQTRERGPVVDGVGSETEGQDASGGIWHVPATVASRLALGMGRAGKFPEAHEVLALFLRSVPLDSSPERSFVEDLCDHGEQAQWSDEERQGIAERNHQTRVLLESAGIALLCMQGRTSEAFDRIYSLYRLGVLEAQASDEEDTPPTGAGSRENSNFFSTNVTPMPGPSNKALSDVFAYALQRAAPLLMEGDWRNEMRYARGELSRRSGAAQMIEEHSQGRDYEG